MPSTTQWCTLDKIAQRPPLSPSSSHASHSGRARSSRVAKILAASSRSWRFPPGAGTAACRTWWPISKCSSSTHIGRRTSSGMVRTTWRYRGTRGSFAAISRLSSS